MGLAPCAQPPGRQYPPTCAISHSSDPYSSAYRGRSRVSSTRTATGATRTWCRKNDRYLELLLHAVS